MLHFFHYTHHCESTVTTTLSDNLLIQFTAPVLLNHIHTMDLPEVSASLILRPSMPPVCDHLQHKSKGEGQANLVSFTGHLCLQWTIMLTPRREMLLWPELHEWAVGMYGGALEEFLVFPRALTVAPCVQHSTATAYFCSQQHFWFYCVVVDNSAWALVGPLTEFWWHSLSGCQVGITVPLVQYIEGVGGCPVVIP